MALLPKEIFKAYDIRGIVGKTLTPEFVEIIGRAIGSEAIDRKQTEICVGFDGRLSGPELSNALIKGILKTGIHVINLGMVTTPMVYFSTFFLKTQSGVMVTGSHNPPDYNGLKMVLGSDTLSTEAIQKLYARIEKESFYDGQGIEKKYDIANDYIEAIKNHIHLKRPMKIVIDCGNGVAGAYARKIYESIGCSVEELFCDVDGTFPNHHPDPSEPHNLNDVIAHLKKSDAELGFAFDGDADRLGVVTKDGQIIYPDRQLLLFAEDVLSRNPNATIIFDVKSTRNLFQWIKDKGGKPLMWKTGHSLIKAKMKEENAALAGEMSGHTFFKERWYGFDDGIYAGVRLLEILSRFDNPSENLNN
jgi:phosphomannomutase/phosphoglucomutase